MISRKRMAREICQMIILLTLSYQFGAVVMARATFDLSIIAFASILVFVIWWKYLHVDNITY